MNMCKYDCVYHRITDMAPDQPSSSDGPFTIKPQFEPIKANINGKSFFA